MKLKISVSILIVCLIAFAVYSASKARDFQPAEDFPRGASVYVQIADLPALVKLWNESKFKEKYAKSKNFHDFKNHHLGLKLASRWEEFGAATGFPIDFDAIVGSIADSRAAVALYDIGKLEFVFIAPVSDEIFAASKFAQNQNNFEQQSLDDGTIVYRTKVEADRGRQKQELIFANVKGRFVLATSEKLLAQTLNNISGSKAKNRLIDEPAFKFLSEKIEPHVATVWVNQTALNEDYYFKRYWLMSNPQNLKNIRAGIFDFSMQEGKLIEHRKFLLDKAVDLPPIDGARANEMLSFLPADAPFYRLRKANRKTLDAAVQNTIFDRRDDKEKPASKRRFYISSFEDFADYSEGRDYSRLSEKFDESVDDAGDEPETIERRETNTDFSKFFEFANAQAILTFTAPKILPAPLFVEFNRAAIFNSASPADFNRERFEAAVARKLSEQTVISASDVKSNWETKSENGVTWRELQYPMLGLSASYAVRGDELILTNDTEFLLKILENQNPQKNEKSDVSFTELTVLNLDQRENAYARVFDELAENDAADGFFTGNVASLIDSISEIKKVEIKESYSHGLLEQIIIGSW